MCKNIVEKGNLDQPLLLYNRTKQRAIDFSQQALPAGKSAVVDSIADGVSKADVIFLALGDDPAVEGVLSQALTSDVKGKLFVDCSTIHPETTEREAETLLAAGAEFVAAPVFGAPAMADSGQLIGLLAGARASVDRARPYFKGVTARAEIDMSDEAPSKATTLKVIGNSFVLNMVEQIAEGHVLAEKNGLGTGYLHQVIGSLFPGPYAAYSTRMLSGDYYKRDEPLFAVDLARKDARHALDLAKAAGTRLYNAETGDRHLAALKEHAGEKGDIAGIYGAVRKEAGLKFENDA